jgi:putative endonuclease
MIYHVYILKCSDNTLYTGVTTDLDRRISEHNGAVPGGAKYTRARQPVVCIYSEICKGRSAAQ